MKEKVLLDTDIGSDIDDAVCLAYLLAKPECDLLGVTAVSGDTQTRAALAEAICRAAGRTEVPVYAGCGNGISSGKIVQPDCNQAPVLKHFDHKKPADFQPGDGVGFLRDTIRANPGEFVRRMPVRVAQFDGGMLEVLVQSLLLSFCVFYWVNNPEKRWLSWVFGILFVLAVLMPIVGLLFAGMG